MVGCSVCQLSGFRSCTPHRPNSEATMRSGLVAARSTGRRLMKIYRSASYWQEQIRPQFSRADASSLSDRPLVHLQAGSSDPQITQMTQIALPKAINNLCNIWMILHWDKL